MVRHTTTKRRLENSLTARLSTMSVGLVVKSFYWFWKQRSRGKECSTSGTVCNYPSTENWYRQESDKREKITSSADWEPVVGPKLRHLGMPEQKNPTTEKTCPSTLRMLFLCVAVRIIDTWISASATITVFKQFRGANAIRTRHNVLCWLADSTHVTECQ